MDNITKKFYLKDTIKKMSDDIKMLGDRATFSCSEFLNFRFLTTIVLFIFIVYTSKWGYIIAPIVAIGYYYLIYYIAITSKIKKRIRDLDHQALYFFEILTLTLESGRNLENSLEITVFNVDSELSNEFKKALFEVKFGKSLIEALEDLKRRIPSETINNINLNITQTNIFGNSILETMNNQIEFLRDKQVLEIKEQINKIPNKVSIVSVIFVVPLIILLILGPFLIDLIA